MGSERASGYPDTHPVLQGHTLTIEQDGVSTKWVTRELWERTVAERDEFRRVLAFISAWRLSSGTRDCALDRLLSRVGEDYDTARAIRGVMEWVGSASRTPMQADERRG